MTVANGKLAHARVSSTPDELASRQKERISARFKGPRGCVVVKGRKEAFSRHHT